MIQNPTILFPNKLRGYLESTGTQYIDTGFTPDGNTVVEAEFQLTAPGTANECIFGALGQFSFRWFGGSSGVFRSNGAANKDFPSAIDSAAKHTVVKAAPTGCTIDGTYSVTHAPANSVTQTLTLFAYHSSDTGVTNQAKVKIFWCKIYDGDTLVRDYQPCEDMNGAACMYDRVNGQYVYNSGTGVFLADGSPSGGASSGDEAAKAPVKETISPTISGGVVSFTTAREIDTLLGLGIIFYVNGVAGACLSPAPITPDYVGLTVGTSTSYFSRAVISGKTVTVTFSGTNFSLDDSANGSVCYIPK